MIKNLILQNSYYF